MTEIPEVGARADVPELKPPKAPRAGAGLLLDAQGNKLKEGKVAGAGGLNEKEVVAAGMLSRLKEVAAGAEGEVAAAWRLPKLKELLELSIASQAKELKL